MTFRVLFRAFSFLLLTGLAVLLGAILWSPTQTATTPSSVTAILTVTAAIFALVLGKIADLWLQQELAEQSRREMCTALHAEILTKLERQALSYTALHRKRTFQRLLKEKLDARTLAHESRAAASAERMSDKPLSAPTSVSQVTDVNLVLDAVKGHIFKLPSDVIGPTVRYYSLDSMLDIAIRATHDAEFQRISPDRRAKAWNDIYKLAAETEKAGRKALSALTVQTRLPANAAPIPSMNYDENAEVPEAFNDPLTSDVVE